MAYDLLILENGTYREYSKNNQAQTPPIGRPYFLVERILNGKGLQKNQKEKNM